MSNESERIDLTGFEGFTRDEWSQNGWHIGPNLIAELNRMYEKEDEIIEYVGYLLATPDVLEQLMGSPSQIHTINNLTRSLEKLLDILKANASE